MQASEITAALQVFGLSKLPETQEELKSIYRKHAKKAHPDRFGGEADVKPIQRMNRAREVLFVAIEQGQGQVPNVWVKFGEGEPQLAKVVQREINSDIPSKYLVALHWFMGMSIQIEDGEWQDVKTDDSFVLNEVRFMFV